MKKKIKKGFSKLHRYRITRKRNGKKQVYSPIRACWLYVPDLEAHVFSATITEAKRIHAQLIKTSKPSSGMSTPKLQKL